jgi:hypothetical protein
MRAQRYCCIGKRAMPLVSIVHFLVVDINSDKSGLNGLSPLNYIICPGHRTKTTSNFLNENLTTVLYNILISIIRRIWGMKMITNTRICRYFGRAIIFLVMIDLIVGTVSCYPFYKLSIHSTEGGSVTTPGEGTF